MIKSTQKVIKIGSSGGVTIPAKEMKLNNIKFGDEVEITVNKKTVTNKDNNEIVETARKILNDYYTDFKNLADR